MNAQDRYTAAAAKMDNIEKRLDKLFEDYDAECKISAECADKLWDDKYKSRYEAMDRLTDAAYNCFWFTSPNIPTQTKRNAHRRTVAKMRAAGLHRMATVKKPHKSKIEGRRMKVNKLNWYSDDKMYLYEIDMIVNGEQILFNSPMVGVLALCTRTELKDGVAKYVIDYGNCRIDYTKMDNDKVLQNVKMELSKLMLDGLFIERIEFIDRYDEFFETMNVEFKIC